MSLPSIAEVELADWPSLQRMCEALDLNPKGRSAVVRWRVTDFVRRQSAPSSWRPTGGHQAALLLRLGHGELAERVWESTIRLDAPAPWVGLGDAQLLSAHVAEAVKSYARAAAMGDPSAYLHRAEALAAAGALEAAARACDEYLEASPRDPRALLMKASLLARAGSEEAAMGVLRTVIDLHPELRGPPLAIGHAALKAGRPAAAMEALEDAVQRDAQDVDARASRGVALLLSGRPPEAIADLREALDIDPRRPDVLNNLGMAYLSAGRPKSAAVHLNRAAKHLESPRIWLNLATVQERLARPRQARGAYEHALRLRPHDPEALEGLARLATTTATSASPADGTPTLKKSRRPRRKGPKSVPSEASEPSSEP